MAARPLPSETIEAPVGLSNLPGHAIACMPGQQNEADPSRDLDVTDGNTTGAPHAAHTGSEISGRDMDSAHSRDEAAAAYAMAARIVVKAHRRRRAL